MINQFRKWLAYGTVNSKFNLFTCTIVGEFILLIITVICLCSVINLKKENKELKQKLNSRTEYLETINNDVLEPLGL
tara:strand:- start:352 stop:582 length:231 start_codon:yes stop_codon:yes gene_type:complete